MGLLSNINGIRLTRREREVYSLIGEGLNSKQIAARLMISCYTVANHKKRILKKKGVSSIRMLLGTI